MDLDDLTPEQARLLAEIDELGSQLDELFAAYPASERDAVLAGLYFDADGVPRTRHRMLRGL